MEVTQAIKKVLVSKGEQVQMHGADQYAVTQSVVVEKEKEEISFDVIKDKDDLNPLILSKEKTVAELQQKVNLKALSNMVLIPQDWSFRGEYSQDESEMEKLAWKLTDFIKRDGTVKIRQSSQEN
ncbi:uncharacterized protein TNCV_2878061 [Trichonephila clavipes]|uniref:DUF382 domain-containing protein n=1 Tax=Trichonephila clavipes TaxID=2585209 RepID=A0A8X6W1V5_TRICX|nr:uncharacterized protein TNCV_2878061 [Trichonephila clavipes]